MGAVPLNRFPPVSNPTETTGACRVTVSRNLRYLLFVLGLALGLQ